MKDEEDQEEFDQWLATVEDKDWNELTRSGTEVEDEAAAKPRTKQCDFNEYTELAGMINVLTCTYVYASVM